MASTIQQFGLPHVFNSMNNIKINDHLRIKYEPYYESGVSEWRRLSAMGKADNIVALCSNVPHRSILEIGAGEGSLLLRLAELYFSEKFYAIEISPSGVKTINNRNIPFLIECKIFDGYHIPYDNNKFDIAILSHILEHVEHPRQLLYEASRVAKYVFVEVPIEDTLRLQSDYVDDSVGHINYYSMKTIKMLIQSCNLKVIKQIVINAQKATYTYESGRKGLINYYIKNILLRLFPFLATNLFTYHSALISEKNIT